MKRILPLLVAATLAASSDAQVSIGNRVGPSFSRLFSTDAEANKVLEKNNNTLLGVSMGLVLEVKIKPFIAVQTEFGLTQKGHQIMEPKQDGYNRLRLNYGEGQLLAKGIVGKGPAKLNILAGASFGRGLVGVSRTANNTFDADSVQFLDLSSSLVDFDENVDTELNRVEISFVGGLGASFDLGNSRLTIEGRHVRGLTSIYNDGSRKLEGTPWPETFNRSLLIQFGYLVQLNDPKSKAPAKPEAPQY